MYIFKPLQLKKSIKPPEIPSKHVRNWVPKVLEQRRQGLELYLQVLLTHFRSTCWDCLLEIKNQNISLCIWSRHRERSLSAFTKYKFCLTQSKHTNCSTDVGRLNQFKVLTRERSRRPLQLCTAPSCAHCNLLLFCLFCQTIIMENGVLPKIFLDFLNIRHFPSVPKTESCGWVETAGFLWNKSPNYLWESLFPGYWKAAWLNLYFPSLQVVRYRIRGVKVSRFVSSFSEYFINCLCETACPILRFAPFWTS